MLASASLFKRARPHSFASVRPRKPVRAAVFVGLLAMSTSALADEAKSVVTVSPILREGLSVRARTRMDEGFRRALRKVPSVTAAPEDCVTESCWRDVGQSQHADVVAFYCAAGDISSGLCDPRHHIQQPADHNPQAVDLPQKYRLGVVLYSPVTKLVTSASVSCESCTTDETAERLQGLTETLLQATAQTDAVGSVQFHSVPAGALVFVDGVLRAQGDDKPIALTLSAAALHRIEIYSSKHKPYREPALRVQAGEAAELTVPMTPIPEGQRGRPSDESSPDSPSAPVAGYGYHTQAPTWRWALPLVLIGAGGLMLGLGGRAMSLRGGCTAQAGCPMTYNTEQVGMGLLGAGGALVGIGGIALAFGVQKVYVHVPPSSGD